ncbi:vegetative cell wall protein gp1 [Parus major]|uniref:vegetative cell wall protein gp1 n=1 Tax=Parus major TaxID=9157 RepID=UPI00077160DA|nr:vegetative cell wall protein gp1 [Parus major]
MAPLPRSLSFSLQGIQKAEFPHLSATITQDSRAPQAYGAILVVSAPRSHPCAASPAPAHGGGRGVTGPAATCCSSVPAAAAGLGGPFLPQQPPSCPPRRNPPGTATRNPRPPRSLHSPPCAGRGAPIRAGGPTPAPAGSTTPPAASPLRGRVPAPWPRPPVAPSSRGPTASPRSRGGARALTVRAHKMAARLQRKGAVPRPPLTAGPWRGCPRRA